jgi:hypothetical protein
MRTRPNLLWRLFVLGGVATMGAVTVDDRAWERFRDLTGDTVPRDRVRQLLVGTAVVHAGESVLALGVARRAGVGSPWRWALSTFVWGFPVLGRLRRARRSVAGAGGAAGVAAG